MPKTRRQFPRAELVTKDRDGVSRFIIEQFINRGATTAAIVSVTEPKLNKFHRTLVNEDGSRVANPYHGHVVKVTFFTGRTGLDTAGQKEKVSDVPLQDHKWGHHFMGSRTILQHNNRPDLYLILYPATDATWYETYYVDTLTNEVIEKHELEDYFPPKGGFDEDYGYRNFKLDSIVLAKIGGETVALEDSPYVNIV